MLKQETSNPGLRKRGNAHTGKLWHWGWYNRISRRLLPFSRDTGVAVPHSHGMSSGWSQTERKKKIYFIIKKQEIIYTPQQKVSTFIFYAGGSRQDLPDSDSVCLNAATNSLQRTRSWKQVTLQLGEKECTLLAKHVDLYSPFNMLGCLF